MSLPFTFAVTESGKYLVKINASALAKSSCFKLFSRIVFNGLREPVHSNNLEYGSAFHKFTKELYQPKKEGVDNYLNGVSAAIRYLNETPCFVQPSSLHLNEKHLRETCERYYQKVYPKDTLIDIKCGENDFLIEKNFAVPLFASEVAEYFLCGTMDRIAFTKDKARVLITDYKTTSEYNRQKFFKNFEMSVASRTYIYGVCKHKELFPESELFGKICASPLGFMIRGVFLSPSKPTEFEDGPIIVPRPSDLLEYETMLESFIGQIDSYLQSNPSSTGCVTTPPRDGLLKGVCSTMKYPCMFFNACNQPDLIAEELYLKHKFKAVTYDPLSINKEK